MNALEISVIVLSYNSEDTIRQTLDSVLAQRCRFSFEVLVGDDGSSDGTPDIIREYADAYPDTVRPILSSGNRGVQANYFDCLEASRGEYIADCAADDFWLGTDRLERLTDALDAAPSAAFSFSSWNKLDGATGDITLTKPFFAHDVERGGLVEPLLATTGCAPVHLSAAVYRKSMLMPEYKRRRDSLFRNRRYACEDLQVLVALAASGSAVYVDSPTLMYRVGHSSAITSEADCAKSARFALATTCLVGDLADIYGLHGSPAIARRMAESYHFALSQAIASGDKELVKSVMDKRGVLPHKPARTRCLLAACTLPNGAHMVRIAKSLWRMLGNR